MEPKISRRNLLGTSTLALIPCSLRSDNMVEKAVIDIKTKLTNEYQKLIKISKNDVVKFKDNFICDFEYEKLPWSIRLAHGSTGYGDFKPENKYYVNLCWENSSSGKHLLGIECDPKYSLETLKEAVQILKSNFSCTCVEFFI